jgi:hypothetical protein
MCSVGQREKFDSSFFKEHFEKAALDATQYQPSMWLRNVDDTFLVWPHGPERLRISSTTPLDTGNRVSQSHITTDGQSVNPSWCRAPSGAHDQIFILVGKLLSYP